MVILNCSHATKCLHVIYPIIMAFFPFSNFCLFFLQKTVAPFSCFLLRIDEIPSITNKKTNDNYHMDVSLADLSKNNITNITENNFRGQDNLHELDLSKNKILRMASSTFRHLTVSRMK